LRDVEETKWGKGLNKAKSLWKVNYKGIKRKRNLNLGMKVFANAWGFEISVKKGEVCPNGEFKSGNKF